MTQRFDRDDVGGKLHIQSLCAMDHLDFNVPDTHSYAQYFDVVARLELGRDSLEQAFRRCAFNVAAANRDDHTKNFGFVCSPNGEWDLAPAYDVNHSYNPEGLWTQRHQMSVNGSSSTSRAMISSSWRSGSTCLERAQPWVTSSRRWAWASGEHWPRSATSSRFTLHESKGTSSGFDSTESATPPRRPGA